MADDNGSEIKSRLDRVARDLNRTLLHGARSMTAKASLPSSLAAGQQIRADVPAAGGMRFNFTLGAQQQPVVVLAADTLKTHDAMVKVRDNGPQYFTLDVDKTIPTWIFHQREFPLPDKPLPEDFVKLPAQSIQHLPPSVLQEVRPLGSKVSVWKYDAGAREGTLLASDAWQPAILLRFPLRYRGDTSPATGDTTGSALFEVLGTPQGERYYLDQLGLLPNSPVTNPPEFQEQDITLLLEDADGRQAIASWNIFRTNLTVQARAQKLQDLNALTPQPSFPYVATQNEKADTLRLLEMVSIANSGGYYIRSGSSKTPTTLVVCVPLKPQPQLPRAANALLWRTGGAADLTPNVIRFEGDESTEVSPFAPPGFASFGWTRTEPADKQSDEDNFGYGTLSLVDYHVTDDAGNVWADGNKVNALSPLRQLPGDKIPPKSAPADLAEAGSSSSNSPALRLLAPHHAQLKPQQTVLADASTSTVRYYRGTVRCYTDTESRFDPLKSAARCNITVLPKIRDVFGNRFDVQGNPKAGTRLFYTDALIAPGEWPGFRFSVFPAPSAAGSVLVLETAYFPVPTDPKTPPAAIQASRQLRIQRLGEILTQVTGTGSDVTVALSAPPLLASPVNLNPVDILTKAISLESQGSAAAAAPILSLAKFPCVADQLKAQALFEPSIVITRTDLTIQPQDGDLPDGILRGIIRTQIRTQSSVVNLALDATPLVSSPDRSSDEFRKIAGKFQDTIGTLTNAQVGFLRNQFNQHELWLIPNGVFPQADQADWAFATARPLDNRLGSDAFSCPDFSAAGVTGPLENYPLKDLHVVDQDLDELGRAAFRLMENEGFRPEVIAVADPVVAREALKNKDAIATTLTTLDLGNTPGAYLIPLFRPSTALEEKPITRVSLDAFRQNLGAFYAVDTILQLPLKRAGSDIVSMFQGQVSNPFSNAGNKPVPSFSDVLLAGGEKSVTVLYEMPPGVNPGDMPPVSSLTTAITHLQRDPDRWSSPGVAASVTAFNQGLWIELASPVQLSWTPALSAPIPVAIRRFPLKPALDVPQMFSPDVTAVTPQQVPLLLKWGWNVTLRMEGLSTDTAQLTVRYNEREEDPNSQSLQGLEGIKWSPATLLQCLVAMKQLSDNLPAISPASRFALIAEFVRFLESALRPATLAALEDVVAQPQDVFDVAFNVSTPANTQFQIMSAGGLDIHWEELAGSNIKLKQGILKAKAEDPGNKAFLVAGASPVYNFRPSVVITRNANIGGPGKSIDPRLIYTCAAVESPDVCLAHKVWSNVTYTPDAGGLLKSLQDFFRGLLNGAPLNSYAVEVAASLQCERNGLSFETPYSIIPVDLMKNMTDQQLAQLIFQRCRDLLGGTATSVNPPPDMTAAYLQLHIKIGRNDGNRRTLVQIDGMKFPLA